MESEDLVSEVLFSCGIEIGFDLTGKLKLSPGLSVDIFVSYVTINKIPNYYDYDNRFLSSFIELHQSCQTLI